jgi:hypothetical protein
MSLADPQGQLVGKLAGDLKPVRPLARTTRAGLADRPHSDRDGSRTDMRFNSGCPARSAIPRDLHGRRRLDAHGEVDVGTPAGLRFPRSSQIPPQV